MTDAPTGTATDVEVSAATVLALLDAGPGVSREAVVRTARDSRHKLAATLLSLWAEDGRALTGAEAAELRLHRERIDHYRRIWSQLQTAAPGVSLLKGMTIAGLYPPGSSGRPVTSTSSAPATRTCGTAPAIWPRTAGTWRPSP